jgi:hypothetical protein
MNIIGSSILMARAGVQSQGRKCDIYIWGEKEPVKVIGRKARGKETTRKIKT